MKAILYYNSHMQSHEITLDIDMPFWIDPHKKSPYNLHHGK